MHLGDVPRAELPRGLASQSHVLSKHGECNVKLQVIRMYEIRKCSGLSSDVDSGEFQN